MRFLSLLCSIVLHLFIIYICIFVTKNSPKINLDRRHIYKVTIIKLQPKKSEIAKRLHYTPKKAIIIRRKKLHIASKKRVIKIPKKTVKRLKKKPVKINIEKQKEKVIKSAFKDVLASLKKEELKKEIVEKAVKKISKHTNTQEDIIGDKIGEEIEDTIEKYKALAEMKIKANWRYPVKQPNLSAEVLIEIDIKGNILDIQFNKPSGNKIFDNSVVRAIKETKKLDPPPRVILTKNKKIIISITFGGKGEK